MRHRSSLRTHGRDGRLVAVVSVGLVVLSAALLLSVLHRWPPTTSADEDRAGRQVPVGSAGASHDAPPRPGPTPSGETHGEADAQGRRAGTPDWRTVLAKLDRRRAAAYAAADPALLRRVYVARSDVMRRDGALLTRYRRRGLRVAGMRMRVLDLRVRVRRHDRAVLVVRERLAHATVRGTTKTLRQAADDVDRHRLTLRHVTGRGWRIAAARPVAS